MLVDARHHDLAQELRRVLGITSETAELRVRLALEAGPEALAVLAAQVLRLAPTADPGTMLVAPGEERPGRIKEPESYVADVLRRQGKTPPGPPSSPPPPKGSKVA